VRSALSISHKFRGSCSLQPSPQSGPTTKFKTNRIAGKEAEMRQKNQLGIEGAIGQESRKISVTAIWASVDNKTASNSRQDYASVHRRHQADLESSLRFYKLG
jgi:hypothetical protein